jgi:hypothetical protein
MITDEIDRFLVISSLQMHGIVGTTYMSSALMYLPNHFINHQPLVSGNWQLATTDFRRTWIVVQSTPKVVIGFSLKANG